MMLLGQKSGYAGIAGQSDTSSSPSVALWQQVTAELAGNTNNWIHDYQDFRFLPATIPTTEAPFGVIQAYSTSGATFATADEDGGPRIAVEATDNEGHGFRSGSQPFKIIRNAGPLVFEARIKKTEVTLASNLFVGLLQSATMSTSIPLTTAGAMSDHNWVGFVSLEAAPATMTPQFKAAGVSVVSAASAFTLSANTYVKVGMRFNWKKDNILEFFLNAVKLGEYLVPSASGNPFPNNLRLGWCIATMGGASSSVNVTPDWIRVAQRRITSAY